MAPKKSFRKAYVGIVMDMALARSKISNRMVAQRLGVDETTIRRWRKENIDFDRAFTEAREALREKINRVAGKSLDVRKRKVVTTSPDGVKTTIEDVLPTHNDIAVFSKALGLGSSVYSDEERQRDVLREVMKHKVAGKYTALEAAQLLEAEGIKVPATLLLELENPKKIEISGPGGSAIKTETTNLTPQEAAELYKKIMG
ncbi:hypothetical protein [Klebsiella aerogenes]|uniref:hypothetical protein n=1 Tax=Klebsiella aerogenes TaxID=548 RepID=UPI0007356EEE|nr:hypothetical protein [Klebsiella aerogenes]ELA2324234.1 hypothetical protein [Klebsiella aerogenes]ELN9405669.1 hypothetical protein [Klebsiella aerogenes]KTH33812.1 hypothetical protein ASV26_08295 [Klebsiella aerogenes]WBN62698.1 hypothetical protein KHW00_11615 [Klebsiella aerogenes]